jgi:hypothetical protein
MASIQAKKFYLKALPLEVQTMIFDYLLNSKYQETMSLNWNHGLTDPSDRDFEYDEPVLEQKFNTSHLFVLGKEISRACMRHFYQTNMLVRVDCD